MTELANIGPRIRESLLSSGAVRDYTLQQELESAARGEEEARQAHALDALVGQRARMSLMTGPRATPPRWKKVRALVRQMARGLSASCGVRITAPVPSRLIRRRKDGTYWGGPAFTLLHPTKGFRRACV